MSLGADVGLNSCLELEGADWKTMGLSFSINLAFECGLQVQTKGRTEKVAPLQTTSMFSLYLDPFLVLAAVS